MFSQNAVTALTIRLRLRHGFDSRAEATERATCEQRVLRGTNKTHGTSYGVLPLRLTTVARARRRPLAAVSSRS